MKLSVLIFFCFVCPILAAIDRYDGSSSSSSESSEGRGTATVMAVAPHDHQYAHARPPREKTNCPDDWMLFKRPQGNWCVRVFAGQFTHPQAEAQCAVQGAKLTGLQTNEERLRMADAGLKVIHQNGFDKTSIWLGAKRKASCQRAGICAPIDTFEWTDGQTTGTDGFDWYSGRDIVQPDGKWRNDWGHQSCAIQYLFASGTTDPSWPGFIHGQLDDQWCQDQGKLPPHKMYACGKLAT